MSLKSGWKLGGADQYFFSVCCSSYLALDVAQPVIQDRQLATAEKQKDVILFSKTIS